MVDHEGPGLVELLHVFALRDEDTDLHCRRVADYCLKLALVLEVTEAERHTLYLAARLHDIGKLFLSPQVTTKPGPLTTAEWEHMRQHPERGQHVIAWAGLDPEIGLVIRHHHERWNGEGYPDGLSAEQIPKLARCLSAADAFDAMTHRRPYRAPLSCASARRELQAASGTQLDPAVAAGFATLTEALFSEVSQRHPGEAYKEAGRWGSAHG